MDVMAVSYKTFPSHCFISSACCTLTIAFLGSLPSLRPPPKKSVKARATHQPLVDTLASSGLAPLTIVTSSTEGRSLARPQEMPVIGVE